MANKKKGFAQLTKRKKNEILDFIVKQDCSVLYATKHFNLTCGTIDKIFSERFQPPEWVEQYKGFVYDRNCDGTLCGVPN